MIFCIYLILRSSIFIVPIFKLDYQTSLKILYSMELIILIVLFIFSLTKLKYIPKSIKIQGCVILPTFLGISLFHLKNLGVLPINTFEFFNSVQMIVLAVLITLRIRKSQIEIQKQKEDLIQVGGDFFDIININNNSVAVFIADASGHGISAALLATMYKMSFTNAISKSSSPAEIFREVNIQTRKVLDAHDFLTAFLITISPIGEITYSSAAHRPALILRKNKNIGEILFTKCLFLGINTNFNAPYEEKKDKLDKGDRLLLYTDGILEESNKNR